MSSEDKDENNRLLTKLDSLSVIRDSVDSCLTTSDSISKRGEYGQTISLIANYIKILASPKWGIFRYNCTFTPDIEISKIRRDLLSKCQINDIAFDGTLLYSYEDLGENKILKGKHPTTNQLIIIEIKRLDIVSSKSIEFFHLANLIVRKLLEISGLRLIGRHYYSFDKKVEFDQYKLTLFPGFITSVNLYEDQLMINVDLSTKILNRQTVYSILMDKFSQFDDIKQAQDMSLKELVGQVVLTPYNYKTYKIIDIAWDKHPGLSFIREDGLQQTLFEYYQNVYRITIKDDKQPLIVVKGNNRNGKRFFKKNDQEFIFLIPELCCITGISDSMRKNYSLMKEINSFTLVTPDERFQRITNLLNDIQQNDEGRQELSKWQIQLDKQLIELEGRTIEPELIIYKNVTIEYNRKVADWSHEGRLLEHLSAKRLEKWIVICCERDSQIVHSFIDALSRVCIAFGIYYRYPEIIELINDRSETFIRFIENKTKSQMDFVCCVLPNNRKDRYDAIKKMLCVDCPIPSQMILSSTLGKSNKLMSIATKIAIQINAKLGGEIWAVRIPSKTLMVVGLDTYRDCQTRSSQMTGFVASINPMCTRYYSRVIEQQNGQEFSAQLKISMKSALEKYYEINNSLPDKIIIYRDGINDVQLVNIIESELSILNEVFMKMQNGYDPKLALIVVKKRGTTRFFAHDSTNNCRLINPPPGTIIDHTITKPESYDFYLISQVARQGTASPTHFNVIWDRAGLKVDQMQRLTQKLCHLYYNWPGTIRVPSVCQYAHKLAFLAAQSLHTQPHEILSDKLFYL